jgi:hypothetical protein
MTSIVVVNFVFRIAACGHVPFEFAALGSLLTLDSMRNSWFGTYLDACSYKYSVAVSHSLPMSLYHLAFGFGLFYDSTNKRLRKGKNITSKCRKIFSIFFVARPNWKLGWKIISFLDHTIYASITVF